MNFGWCFKPALFNSKVLFLQQNTIFVCLEIVSLKAYLHVSLYDILISCNSSYQKNPKKKNNPLWNQEPTGEKKMLFSQFDLQLTGGTWDARKRLSRKIHRCSSLATDYHKDLWLVALEFQKLSCSNPKKCLDFILKSLVDALFITRPRHHRPPLTRPNIGFHLSIFCSSNVCMVSFTFTITTCKTCRESPKLFFEPNHLDMFKRKLNQLWLGGTIVWVPAGMSTFNKVTWFKAKNQLSLGVIRLESGRTKWSRIFHFLRVDDDFFWHCLHYLQWSYHQPVTVDPSNLRNSNLLHAKVSTLFKTIIFGIRAKFPRPNESYFGILGFLLDKMHSITSTCQRFLLNMAENHKPVFVQETPLSWPKEKWEGAGRSLLYILDSVHPGLKITSQR